MDPSVVVTSSELKETAPGHQLSPQAPRTVIQRAPISCVTADDLGRPCPLPGVTAGLPCLSLS